MTRSALFAAALLLAACESSDVRRSGALSTDIFEDIPAPKSAFYVHAHQESFAYSGKTYRCGRFVYEYQGDPANAARFFRKTMLTPPYSWSLLTEDSTEVGSYTLVFEKNEDRCTIDIDRVPKPDIGKKHNVHILVRVNYRK